MKFALGLAALATGVMAETTAQEKEDQKVNVFSNPADKGGDFLGPHDVVGTTFYIACNMMLAFTLFFFVQVGQVPKRWKTSVSIAGLVTGIAWYNYCYMKECWVKNQDSPTNYRYTDWLITVPLQIVEFYFILKASGPVSGNLGTRLFLASLAMVMFGWLAEIDVMAKLVGFVLGCMGWLYIVYEAYAGEAAGELYGYGHSNVLFKPTKAAEYPFRPTGEEAMSYFVGGDVVEGGYEEDGGFAINGGKGWSDVVFTNHQIEYNGGTAIAMGSYVFTCATTGDESKVEYTFGYKRNEDGKCRIFLHHSSVPYAA